jgi:tRNA nucleotidyltransferase (CCA-adding enzyme)
VKKRELPPAVARCCRVLRQAGHQAYPVGGCVRDLLLGRVPQDWDVTTSALPEQVESLFPRTLPTGLRHGTVSVLEEGECIEVTTFRRETGYADHRHPDRVEFVPELREDLARRDFTVNAMALGESGEVIDFFDGQADLKGGILRCVGEPDLRFQEDALRMLRAVRFSAQLGFQIQGETLAAMERQARLARRLSAERVRVEVEKTICAPRPEQGELLFRLGLLEGYTSRRQVELTGLLGLENLAMLRWAGLCALLELGEGTGEFLTRLRLDGGTVRACRAGARLFANGLPEDGRAWRHALAQTGLMGCRAAAAMGDAWEGGGMRSGQLNAQLAAGVPFTPRQLALSGGELFQLGLRGPEIGQAQARLLEHVLERPEDNQKAVLRTILEDGLGGAFSMGLEQKAEEGEVL